MYSPVELKRNLSFLCIDGLDVGTGLAYCTQCQPIINTSWVKKKCTALNAVLFWLSVCLSPFPLILINNGDMMGMTNYTEYVLEAILA